MSDSFSKLKAEIGHLKQGEEFNQRTIDVLEMIAIGQSASEVYSAIAMLYESRYPGLRCSMLELVDGKLLHGGAPSLPKEYCEAVNGLEFGPNVGSCGSSTYTGKRCVVENIETDPKWEALKQYALPHGMRCCWSEPIKDSNGRVLGAFGMYYDYPATPSEEQSRDLISGARLSSIVMERDHNQKRIRELAYIDTLTKLSSRACFFQHTEGLIRSAIRLNRTFSLFYIDLDNFKAINDSQGHDVGDELLREVAGRLRKCCREIDFIARLGGDEFCLVTEVTDDRIPSGFVAQRCIDAISEPLTLGSMTRTITCSIGVSHFPDDGEMISTLLKAADTALYSAKNSGKNCYAFYEKQLTKIAEHKFYFEQAVRDAINNNELTLVYQPIVSAHLNEIVGVEALARWHHPSLGQVPPIKFIKTAEHIGLIAKLTEWALRVACYQAAEWKKAGIQSIVMSVNISPTMFLDDKFVDVVEKIIDLSGVDSRMLELEVTESATQTNPDNLSIFDKLKKLGVTLSIDDFGTGYSSFSSLKHIKFDKLKIDKYFIDGIMTDPGSRHLVASMVDIGHSFGNKIIAEGVELEEQLDILREIGCDYVQGFLFGKPMEAAELFKKMKRSLIFGYHQNSSILS